MKTIGIIGGIGPEATMDCYSYIVDRAREQLARDGDYSRLPNIIIYSLGEQKFAGLFGEPDQMAKIRAVIEALHRAGADFVIGACNSLHVVYDRLSSVVPIPWISIMDATAEAILKAGMSKVGLMGAMLTMTDGFYQQALSRHGIEVVAPSEEAIRKIDGIINTELVWNKMTAESKKYLLACVDDLARRGAQGVILGCTELPLIVKQKDTPIRVFPTTTILAQRALDEAWGNQD
jgi:aspartate racemase